MPTQNPQKKTIDADSSNESTEEDMNVLLKGLEELDFDQPRFRRRFSNGPSKSGRMHNRHERERLKGKGRTSQPLDQKVKQPSNRPDRIFWMHLEKQWQKQLHQAKS